MTIRRQERGATLVVTLIILVVITIIGVAAIRGSTLNLTIATNSQIKSLLFEAADAGTNAVEQQVASNPDAARATTGLMGGALLATGEEQRYCVGRNTADTALELKAGVCDISTTSNYLSGRSTAIVQTAVLAPKNEVGEPKEAIIIGQDNDQLPSYIVDVYSTAVMPNVGDASEATIEGCLDNANDESTSPSTITTVSECLASAGASYTTTAQEYCYGFFCYPSVN